MSSVCSSALACLLQVLVLLLEIDANIRCSQSHTSSIEGEAVPLLLELDARYVERHRACGPLSEAHWSKHELGPPKLLGPDSEPPVAGLGLTSSKLPSFDSIELLQLKDPVSAWKYTHRRHSSRHCRQGCRWAQRSGEEGPFHPAGLPFATRHRRRGWRPLLVVPGSTRLRILLATFSRVLDLLLGDFGLCCRRESCQYPYP